MTRVRLREYLIFLSILAVLTALAIVGMLQIFKAADEARHSVKVSQCQNVVLGDYIHKFHISVAKIEALELNSEARQTLIKEALAEPDIAREMLKCEQL